MLESIDLTNRGYRTGAVARASRPTEQADASRSSSATPETRTGFPSGTSLGLTANRGLLMDLLVTGDREAVERPAMKRPAELLGRPLGLGGLPRP